MKITAYAISLNVDDVAALVTFIKQLPVDQRLC